MKGPFNPVEMIRSKRDGRAHSAAEIREFIEQFGAGAVADYQMSAWLMAVFLRGMTDAETVALTQAMLHSGKVLRLPSVKPAKVDKHSTGGVGDKISICLAPLVAACGVAVPMISGRGLGHTGGTLDKLEAIPGYRVQLSAAALRARGARGRRVDDWPKRRARAGRSPDLCPARRDCHRRVHPADRGQHLVQEAGRRHRRLGLGRESRARRVHEGFEVGARAGSGAGARRHAAGKRVVALLTAMDAPIGRTIGNGLETREAIEILRNSGPADTRELTLTLGAEMLLLGKVERSLPSARARLERALADGSALDRFMRMVKAHGGDVRVVEHPERLANAKAKLPVLARRSGYLSECDAYALGMSGIALGAGRTRADQAVDPSAGHRTVRTAR